MFSGQKFDLTAVLYINSLYILLMLFPFRLKYNLPYKKFLKILFFVTNGIALAANFIDVVYFRYVLRRSDFSIFTEFKNESQLWKIGLVGLVQFWYLVVILVGLLLLIKLVYGDHESSNKNRSNSMFYLVSAVTLV